MSKLTDLIKDLMMIKEHQEINKGMIERYTNGIQDTIDYMEADRVRLQKKADNLRNQIKKAGN